MGYLEWRYSEGNMDCNLCSQVYNGLPPCESGDWTNIPLCKPLKEPDLAGIDLTALNVFGFLEPLRRFTIEPMSGYREPVPFSFSEISDACKSCRNPSLVTEIVIELEYKALSILRELVNKEYNKKGKHHGTS